MNKAQIVDKMRAKMNEDFQMFSDGLPQDYKEELIISNLKDIYMNAYAKGMDNMFNLMKDELLTNFA